MIKSSPPSIKANAFDCPHCGAYTQQFWFDAYFKPRGRDSPIPIIWDESTLAEVEQTPGTPQQIKDAIRESVEAGRLGDPFMEGARQIVTDAVLMGNVHLSRCYVCKRFAIWLTSNLLHPQSAMTVAPNDDLEDAVTRDYAEASAVLGQSPRASCALLRLALEKVVVTLGAKGKDLNEQIKDLVSRGLSPLVEHSLDSLRVIGNEAVHPGTLDLRDDRETAIGLFTCLNLVAEQMISNPKHAKAMYDKIPQRQREAIEKRDANK